MVVDDEFKTHFSEKSVATKAATELLSKYAMPQVEIYETNEDQHQSWIASGAGSKAFESKTA